MPFFLGNLFLNYYINICVLCEEKIKKISNCLFRTQFDLEHLILVVIILYENQQFTLAQKLFDMACVLNSRIRAITLLSEGAHTLTQFIIENITNSPFLSPSDIPANPAIISTIVNNLLSLCSSFLVSGPTSLLSPRGMQILLRSLMTICPPSACMYELFPLANVPSNNAYSPRAIFANLSPKNSNNNNNYTELISPQIILCNESPSLSIQNNTFPYNTEPASNNNIESSPFSRLGNLDFNL